MKKLFGYAIPSTTLYSNSTCGIPSKDYFNMIKGFDSDFPWSGLLLGQLINGVWYGECTFSSFFKKINKIYILKFAMIKLWYSVYSQQKVD
jgi:hypothetical protein